MKLNIHNVQEMTMREEVSGDSHWRKIIVKSGSLQAPEKFEINLFWERPPRHPSEEETQIIQIPTTQTIKA